MLCRCRHNIHLIRNTFRLASRKNIDAIKRNIKPIYTAPNLLSHSLP
jgi:transposase-like protein